MIFVSAHAWNGVVGGLVWIFEGQYDLTAKMVMNPGTNGLGLFHIIDGGQRDLSLGSKWVDECFKF